MKQKIILIAAIVAWCIPVVIAMHNVLSGSIAFWYDPARDMLSAWVNLSKLTLIGPPSGIPGIFYGPYWIWWLSLGEIISKDPRVVLLVTTTLPYLIIFPLVLYFFTKVFDKTTSILLWILFFFGYQGYVTSLWNPNLAPLLFVTIILLLIMGSLALRKKMFLYTFLAGIITGLALNIHISFSMGFMCGCILYLLTSQLFEKSNLMHKITQFVIRSTTFVCGIGIMFVPFFIFEKRHGFEQTHAAFRALSQGGGVVTVVGLSKSAILTTFFGRLGTLLELPLWISIGILAICVVMLIVLTIRKNIRWNRLQLHLLLLFVTVSICVLGLYLSVKNPIWDYHFIGVEILWLLFVGLLVAKIKYVKYFFIALVGSILIFHTVLFVKTFSQASPESGSLINEEKVVSVIKNDAGGRPYTVYVYSPSIYTYEYSYLFKWLAKKYVPYDPGRIQRMGDIYLILPPGKVSATTDFIHYRTPASLYKTTRKWIIVDKIVILKRSLL